ncbi:MAG: glycerol-3-phosphate cytidylyltransferase [Flavobacteriales bacterium]|nr:glycerol-3-phosphate cytidylyltransferase [Flavobacteriales bacterium]
MTNKSKIVIVGAGFFGTALANSLSLNADNEVVILSISESQVDEINNDKTNHAFFPNRKLNNFRASLNFNEIKGAKAIFLAIPSTHFLNVSPAISRYLSPGLLIVNLSKGFGSKGEILVDLLKDELNHENVVSLKGPTFASELLAGQPSMFTLGFNNKWESLLIKDIFLNTNIFLDYTTDVVGVEVVSAIKNIYAIMIGYVDAKYNSANTRFMVLTKAVNEIKLILPELNGHLDTLFLSCGIGDLSLSALNDLSRNRTLGLLIGKGFYNENLIEGNSVVVEGANALRVIKDSLTKLTLTRLPLFNEVDQILNNPEYKFNIQFDKLIDQNSDTVLTYGTFDLLHYGHLEILKKAKSFGTKLIVGLSSDSFNKLKGKKSIHSYKKRKEFLESLEYVDLVIPEDNWEQKETDVQKYDVDIFIMGDDWKGKFDFLDKFCRVEYLPRTEGISTTKLKSIL